MANFEQYFPTLLKHEGGFSNDKNDGGGATKYGITHEVLSNWRNKPVSIDDVKNITQEEAKKIYMARYWTPMNMDKVNHQALAETLFDMGVNAGIGRAGKMVQLLLNKNFGKNLIVDGGIGQNTITAINSVDGNKLYNLFNVMRVRYYTFIANRFDYKQSDSTYLATFFKQELKAGERESQADFIKGWLRRVASFPYLKETAMGVGGILLLVSLFFLVYKFSKNKN